MPDSNFPFQNQLLAGLLPEDLDRLGSLEIENLPLRRSLEKPDEALSKDAR